MWWEVVASVVFVCVVVAALSLYLTINDKGLTSRASAAAPAASPPATSPRPSMAAKAAELRDFTVEDLKAFDGRGDRPIYVGVDGWVFNMSSHPSGPEFYGPGAGYGVFAGKDATVGLATMQLDPTAWVKTKSSELSAAERDTVANWLDRFRMKYQVVGFLNDGANPTTVAQARERGYAV